jgi:hypothetical protein
MIWGEIMSNEKYWDGLISEFEGMSDEEFLKTIQEAEEQIPGDLFCEFSDTAVANFYIDDAENGGETQDASVLDYNDHEFHLEAINVLAA